MRTARNIAFLLMLCSLMLIARPLGATPEDPGPNCSEYLDMFGFDWGPCDKSCTEMLTLQCPNYCNSIGRTMWTQGSDCWDEGPGYTGGYCACKSRDPLE